MNELTTVGSLATPVMVIGTVTLLKDLGVKGKATTLAAVLVGILAAFAQTYADPGLMQTLVTGLQLGLGGAGIYDIAHHRVNTGGKHHLEGETVEGTVAE